MFAEPNANNVGPAPARGFSIPGDVETAQSEEKDDLHGQAEGEFDSVDSDSHSSTLHMINDSHPVDGSPSPLIK